VATFKDAVFDCLENVYSFTQVKDRIVYLNANITDAATTFVTSSSSGARQINEGMILEFSTDTATASEQVRVRSVDTTTNTVTIVRGVNNTTAAAWTAATCVVRIEPEYPKAAVVREVNKTVMDMPPHIWAYPTFTTTTDVVTVGYVLPSTAKGVQAIRYLTTGPENYWHELRRWRWDPVNKIVDVFNVMEPGRSLKITYRADPTEFTDDADTFEDVGLADHLVELVTLGAVYRLVSRRMSGRLVDTRAETPLNGSYRTADPVAAAIRSLYAQYQELLKSAREQQRLEYPAPLYYKH
jgi:hypothetical protein